MPKREKKDYAIQAVAHALQVLEHIAASEGEMGVTELATLLGLHKNNVFRLLATLETHGFVEQSSRTEQYRLSRAVVGLMQGFARHTDIVVLAAPVLDQIAVAVNETAVLDILRSDRAVAVGAAESKEILRAVVNVGRSERPATSVAGRVLLAYLSQTERDRFLADANLNDLQAKRVRRDIDTIRQQGFIVDLGETEKGIVTVAAPVFDYNRQVVAVVRAVAPVARTERRRADTELVPAVTNAASELSRRLGYSVETAVAS